MTGLNKTTAPTKSMKRVLLDAALRASAEGMGWGLGFLLVYVVLHLFA